MSADKTATDKATNNVRVSSNKSRFLYVDVTKYLLSEGQATVEITGLGQAISEVCDIVEILKSQGVVEVVKINTTRDVEGARRNTDKILVVVKKSKDFDKIFAEQKKAKEAAAAEKKDDKKEEKKEEKKDEKKEAKKDDKKDAKKEAKK